MESQPVESQPIKSQSQNPEFRNNPENFHTLFFNPYQPSVL